VGMSVSEVDIDNGAGVFQPDISSVSTCKD